jgi:hypothetical protein
MSFGSKDIDYQRVSTFFLAGSKFTIADCQFSWELTFSEQRVIVFERIKIN